MKLYDANSNLIDVIVAKFIKKTDQTKIVNKLYDGSYQVQSIGRYNWVAEIIIYASPPKMDTLNIAESISELLIVEKNNIKYFGYINKPINWKEVIKFDDRYYLGTFEFLINEVV